MSQFHTAEVCTRLIVSVMARQLMCVCLYTCIAGHTHPPPLSHATYPPTHARTHPRTHAPTHPLTQYCSAVCCITLSTYYIQHQYVLCVCVCVFVLHPCRVSQRKRQRSRPAAQPVPSARRHRRREYVDYCAAAADHCHEFSKVSAHVFFLCKGSSGEDY